MAVILLYMFSATVGKLQFSHILEDFIFSWLEKTWDIWHPKLNSVGHQDRTLKTHETGMNRVLIHKAHIIHVLCSVEFSLLYILRNSR